LVENGKKQIKIKPAYYVNYTKFTDKETVVSLRNLTEQKYNIKHDLKKFEAQLKTEKELLNLDKQDLLLKTDFEAKGITNQKKRDAYVNKDPEIQKREKKIKIKQVEVDAQRVDYEIACDELENYRLLIRLEIAARNEAATEV
jgi:CRISPR/Cas system-associated protein Cas5 (RAMP superfamily)